MSTRPSSMARWKGNEAWQDEAWRYYDEVGELRFGVGWLSNGMSRVNLVPARIPENLGDEPTPIRPFDPNDPESTPNSPAETQALQLVKAIAGGPAHQGALLGSVCTQLSIPGVGWIVLYVEPPPEPVDGFMGRFAPITITTDPAGIVEEPPPPDESWKWQVLAYDELRVESGRYEWQDDSGTWQPVPEPNVIVRVWRPHARRRWQPDSPCRATLNVLRQITMLDEHIDATIQSRLAGAGLLVIPSEAEFTALPPDPDADPTVVVDDDFVETLKETMTVAIGDRGVASAVVPLVIRIPGEFCDKVQHLTFWSEFSAVVLELREAAIKRLALGLDLPPETLLGVAGMNHWGAWQVAEEAVTLHVEPMSETVCAALTLGYLTPAMQAAYPNEANDFLVWYDTTDLTTRPDRSADAIALYDRIELSGEAARREAGLSESDAPDEEEYRRRVLLEAAKGAPTLAPQMLAAAGLLEPDVADAADAAAPAPQGDQTSPPPAETDPGPPDGPAEEPAAASAARTTLEACDGLVWRALERAGGRLRSAAGRRNGGPTAIPACDPAVLHTLVDATRHDLDALLDGAWSRVPTVAARLDVDPDALTRTLNTYTRALLATGHAHDLDRLADALGIGAGAR